MSQHKQVIILGLWPVEYHLQMLVISGNGWGLVRRIPSTLHQGNLATVTRAHTGSYHLTSARPLPLQVHIQSFSIPHFPSLMIAMAKPAYLSIVECAPPQPVIIFVPPRRQSRPTASDIWTCCLADQKEDRFLNISLDHLTPHLEHIADQGLIELLKHGIAYYHEAMDPQDARIVEKLFESGAVQVIVASRVSRTVPSGERAPKVFDCIRKPRGFCQCFPTW